MPVASAGATAPGLTAGCTWRSMRCGAAGPMARPWYSTSMTVRSNGVNSRSTMRPTSAASTSYRLPCRETVANAVTRRCSRHRNARRNSAGSGRGGWVRPWAW